MRKIYRLSIENQTTNKKAKTHSHSQIKESLYDSKEERMNEAEKKVYVFVTSKTKHKNSEWRIENIENIWMNRKC